MHCDAQDQVSETHSLGIGVDLSAPQCLWYRALKCNTVDIIQLNVMLCNSIKKEIQYIRRVLSSCRFGECGDLLELRQ